MWCREAARRLVAAPVPMADAPDSVESRFAIGPRACAIDSNSLMTPADDGTVVVTGSHGALLGGRPETAARAAVFAALYNDADGGIDGAGFTRLPALDARGIAACTYSAWTARIGDGRSAVETGIVSAVNARAASLGVKPGGTVRDAVALLADASLKEARP
jgi:type 1 fimbria pilin